MKVLFYQKKKRIHYPSIFLATYYWNLLQNSGKLGRKSWNPVNLEPFFPWKILHTCRNCSFWEEIWQKFAPQPKKTIDFSTCGARLCNGWNWNQCFCGDKFYHFFKKKFWNFLEFFFLSVNSILFLFSGIFRQHFHVTKLRPGKKKQKKSRIGTGWGLRFV